MVHSIILGPFRGAILLIWFAIFVVKLWAFIDALTRPAPAYEATGKQTKVFWCVLLCVALFVSYSLFALAGLIAAIVYLVDVRPAVREVGRGGQGGWYR